MAALSQEPLPRELREEHQGRIPGGLVPWLPQRSWLDSLAPAARSGAGEGPRGPVSSLPSAAPARGAGREAEAGRCGCSFTSGEWKEKPAAFSPPATAIKPPGRGAPHCSAMLRLPLALAALVLRALRSPLSVLGWSLASFWPRLRLVLRGSGPSRGPTPTSVNYHFTRRCNYKCGFCFHTAKTSFELPLEEAQRGLAMLRAAGMEKINFSGGEPFLTDRGEFVGKLVQFCKQELKLPSVSIVSNGSLIRERWFKNYGEYLDILAISCDSFHEEVNALIGRGQGKKKHVENLQKLRKWCQEYGVAFKLNSVINRFNVEEDMNEQIKALNPVRWKVFQCLLIDGENVGENALREAEKFVISDEDFERFLDRHRDISCLVPESNQKMKDSYLILDEYMRFLNCRNGRKEPSKSILDVGVEHAIKFSGFDEEMFLKRGGKYVWSKADMKLEW